MPPIKEHLQLSLKRTGKTYQDLHEWMDDPKIPHSEKEKRHDILNIPYYLPIIKNKFGESYIKEYLFHIKDDYERSRVLLFYNQLRKLKFWK